jgi:hypothetical protein
LTLSISLKLPFGIDFLLRKLCNLPPPVQRQNGIKQKTMDVQTLGVMIPIISIIGLFVMIIYLRRYQNTERMAMIEKGVSPELFASRQSNASATLRASLLLIGVGIGFLLGYFLDRNFDMEHVGYFAMLFIFGGIGLGLAYLIEEKRRA